MLGHDRRLCRLKLLLTYHSSDQFQLLFMANGDNVIGTFLMQGCLHLDSCMKTRLEWDIPVDINSISTGVCNYLWVGVCMYHVPRQYAPLSHSCIHFNVRYIQSLS